MRLLKQTVVVFVATAFNFLFSYFLHFVLGRLLGPVEYGRYGVVLNLAWITSIPLSAVSTSLIKFSANFRVKHESEKLKFLLVGFLKFIFLLNLVFTLGYVLFSSVLSNALGGGVSFLIVVLALSFIPSGVGGVLLSFLQGVGKTYSYSLISGLSTLFKLFFALLFVSFGFGVGGALLSLVFSGFCLFLLCLPFVKSYFKQNSKKFSFSPIFRFGLSVLFANFFINLVLYFDLFFVSSFLGSEMAGFYSAAVTLSRAFLMSSAVMAVFFPEFSGDSAVADFKRLRSNLKLALFYTVLICFAGLFVFWVLPDFIVNLTYSSSYLSAVPILRVLSVGYTFYSLFSVLVYALWALGKHKLVGFFGIALFVCDLVLLSLLVPVYGVLGAAWITTGLLVVLFFFALFVVFSRILKK